MFSITSIQDDPSNTICRNRRYILSGVPHRGVACTTFRARYHPAVNTRRIGLRSIEPTATGTAPDFRLLFSWFSEICYLP